MPSDPMPPALPSPPATAKGPRGLERGRRALAATLAGLGALACAATLVPAPSFALWTARVASLELGLFVAAAALVALVLAGPAAREGGLPGAVAVTAAPVLVASLIQALAAVPLYVRAGLGFSPREYLLGVATAGTKVELDLVLDPELPYRADLHRPAAPGPHPLVVVLHGGAWRGGDKGSVPHVSSVLAAQGYVVADLQYGLAPRHPFPEAVGHVKCLLGRIRERAGAFDVDPRRVALLGRSAGGQVALVAAYSAGDSRIPPACAVADEPVAAVVALYAPTDLVAGYSAPVRPDVVRGPEALEGYLGGTPDKRPEAYRLATPQTWTDHPVPATLLIHGSGDRLVHAGHSRSLAAALRRAGRPVELLEIPYAEHGFDVRPGGVGEQLARGALLDFMARTLGR